MNVPFKLISEPAARRFGNCVWDLVPQRTESSLPFLYTPPTLHWDRQRNIPTILIRLRTKKMQTETVYDSLPNNWRELFVFKSIYRDTAFSPWKKCLLFFVSSNDNDHKNYINQIQNKSQWKSCAMKTVKIFLVLSDLYNEQTSSLL